MSGDDKTRISRDSMKRFTPGTRIANRYRIVALRGVGGMGLVYEAHDDELGVTVALKVIRPELASDPGLIERFRRELLLGRQVSHPNVVRIHDIGQDGDLYFMTMDYVDGKSLRDLLKERGRLDEPAVLALLRPIAEALAAAHQAGVVHRDLKPGNILVDSSDRPHISDFGLARSIASSRATEAGAVVGTPDYLSPEQAKGENVDARTDVYALGIIVFEMLTGELPFAGGSFAEIVAQRIAGRPRDLAQHGVHVSPRLAVILKKCLEPSPARRFSSAAEIVAALDAPEPALSPRLRRLAVVAGVIGAAFVLGAIGWRLAHRAGEAAPQQTQSAQAPAAAPVQPVRSTSLAVLPLHDETGTPTLAWMSTGIAEMLVDALAQSPKLRVVEAGRTARMLRDLSLDTGSLTDETMKRIADLLDVEMLVVGSARARGDLLRVDAQLVRFGALARPVPISDEAGSPGALVASLSRDVRKTLDLPTPPTVVPVSEVPQALAAFHKASELLARGDSVLAEPALEEAVKADPGFGVAWYKLAEVCETNGKRDRATEAIGHAVTALGASDRLGALAQARQASLRGDPERAQQVLSELLSRYPADVDSAVALADAYGQAGRLSEARQTLERVVAAAPNHPRGLFLLGKYSILAGDSRKAVDDYLVRALVVENNLRSLQGRADVLNAFGVAYRELGDAEHAREKYAEAAELRRQIGDQRGYATTLRNLAQIQTASGKTDEAAKSIASAIRIFETLGDKAGRADAINDLGVLEETRGNYRQALARYREALQIRHALGDRRAEAESLNNVGYANQLLGDSDNASVYWHQALDLYHETGNREGEITVTQSLGQLQLAQGHWNDAVKSYLKALDQSRESEMLPASAVSLGYLGRIAQYQGRYAAALTSYEQGLKVLDALKDERGLAEFTLARAETWIELGQLDEAHNDLGRAQAWLPEGSNHEQRAEWLRLTARTLSRGGDPAAASATLAKAREEAVASQNPAVALKVEIDQGLQLLAEKHVAEAVRGLQSAVAHAERLGDAALRLSACEALARASVQAKDLDQAERVVGDGLRLAESCGAYSGTVRFYRLQALAARARGDESAAQADLARAATEMRRVQQGLPPNRAEALEKRIVEETS